MSMYISLFVLCFLLTGCGIYPREKTVVTNCVVCERAWVAAGWQCIVPAPQKEGVSK